jgi:hypothetical protein
MENEGLAAALELQAADEANTKKVESLRSIEEVIDFLSSLSEIGGVERDFFVETTIATILALVARNKNVKLDMLPDKLGIKSKVSKLLSEMYK